MPPLFAQMKGACKDGPEVFLRGLFVIVPLSLCTRLFADLSRGISVPPVPAEKTVLKKKKKN